MGIYYGLIIPRSYNDYINRSDAQGMLQAMKNTGIVPNAASAQNELADKNFVNSTVGTNTANYIYKTDAGGENIPFDSVDELEAYSGTVTQNDYAFVTGIDENGNRYYDRYKANVNDGVVTWAKEYRLNNSSFTAEQWAAIQSGITAELAAKIGTVEPANITDCNNPPEIIGTTNSNTLNTPYKAGLTNFASGMLITTPTSTNYMTQFFMTTGNAPIYKRSKQQGSWQPWERFILESDLFYKRGETITLKTIAAGYSTSNNQNLYMGISLPKRLPDNPTFTISKLLANGRGSNSGLGGYVDADGSNASVSGGRDFIAIADRVTLTKINDNFLQIALVKSTKWYICGKNTDNNYPLVWDIANLTFTIN